MVLFFGRLILLFHLLQYLYIDKTAQGYTTYILECCNSVSFCCKDYAIVTLLT